ncbi:MAG: sulfatase [Myxococcota bacterium]|jgi:arylsulfatase
MARTALLLAAMSACSQQPLPLRPDIFLITVDTLRADHLGAYGYTKPTSPRLDRLARESLVFEHCRSHASNTRPSIASLLTGFLPHETHMLDGVRLPNALDTLPEILKRQGYVTRAVVSNWVLSPKAGLNQGFDVYDARMQERERNRPWPERVAAQTTAAAIKQLDTPRDGPLFLWVHYQDPHGPYTPPGGLQRAFRDATPPRLLALNPDLSGLGGIPSYQQLGARRDFHDYVAAYDGEIRHMDEQVGRLLDALAERDLYERSLLIFTADHGEGLGERNFYFNHVGYLYDTLTHVPLMLRRGDRFSGRRDDACQLIDVVPTVLGALGLDADPRLRGRDLFDPDAPESPTYAETRSTIDKNGSKYSLIDAGYHLIYNPVFERVELFDLANDPDEQRDLSAEPAHQQRREAMLARIAAIRADDRTRLAHGSPPELSKEDRRKLRSLGYVE